MHSSWTIWHRHAFAFVNDDGDFNGQGACKTLQLFLALSPFSYSTFSFIPNSPTQVLFFLNLFITVLD